MTHLQEIATRTGVSTRTAYRILSGGNKEAWPSVAKRADKVRRVAVEIGYRPNLAARATRLGKFDTLGLIMSTETQRSTFPMPFLNGVETALRERDMHLVVARMGDEQLTDEAYLPGVLRRWMVDGVLMYYAATIPERIGEILEGYRLPAAWVNCKRPHDCVRPNDEQGGYDATRHLLELGHRRVAFASFSDSPHYSVGDRREGYRRAMNEASLPAREWRHPLQFKHHLYEGPDFSGIAMAWLSSKQRPTGVVTDSSRSGVALTVAAWRLGLRVPEDISVIHVDQEVNDPGGFGSTCMYVLSSEMGQLSVETLLGKLQNPETPLPPRVLPFRLWPGRTCGPAPRKSSQEPAA